MKSIWVYTILSIAAMVAAREACAQMHNYGALFVDTSGKIGIHADFINGDTATLTNKGNVYALQNIQQDGVTDYDGGKLSLVGNTLQTLSGQHILKTTGLEFSNAAGFELLKKVSVAGNATFTNGIVTAADSLEPLEFNPDGTGAAAILPIAPSDISHVDAQQPDSPLSRAPLLSITGTVKFRNKT